MDINSQRFLSIEQLQDQFLNNNSRVNTDRKTSEGYSFQDILTQKSAGQTSAQTSVQTLTQTEVRFSKHAANRLSSRNIELSKSQMDRLELGTQKASEKGIKDSLVLVDSLAFIVNVPSSTVITAMNQSETEENIFTNIDGAVIV